MRDTLFLFAPGFVNTDLTAPNNAATGRCEYCPECAEIWGLLSYFPAIQHSLDIEYQPLDRPRAAMVTVLGDENQNCPTLVLHRSSPSFESCAIMQKNGHRFINNARDIGLYYALRFGTPCPRGHSR